MKLFVALAALLAFCDARPSGLLDEARATAFESVDVYIIGGSNASPGAWPWQLSQQRLSGGTWSHSCGASLLSARYGLSAAHCVDGSAPANLRVLAGLHDRSNPGGATTANIASFKMHEQYNVASATYANDIAILTFSSNIAANGGNIAYATLPASNANDFAGQTCIITGWGRTSSAQTLPNILQQAPVGILSTSACQSQATGATIWANHICIKDSANNAGACNGDSGGPVNCGGIVAGVASFVFQSAGACMPSRPSVYTRVSGYLSWIASNTP